MKTVIIGLDGASPEIFFDKWKNELPNIKKIIETGAHGILKSTLPTSTGPAWTSIATGCMPEKHGIFNFVYPDKNINKIKPNNSSKIKCKTFYEILEDNGKKCILINLPNSYPPKTNNITITSLLTSGDDFIFPKKLIEEIPELKNYRISPNNRYLEKNNLFGYIQDISNLEKNRFQCAKKLFNKKWDVFFILFSGTDWVQHQTYSNMINKDINDLINKKILEFYKEIDNYIGWFLDNKKKEDNLMILSDHGFKTYNGYFFINTLFEKLGLLSYEASNSDIKTTKIKEDNKKLSINFGKIIKKIRKNKWIYNKLEKFYLIFKKIIPLSAGINLVVNPKFTKIAALRGTEDAIFINKEGYQDYLIKKQDYEKFRNFIINILNKIKDPENKLLFDKIIKNVNEVGIPDILINSNKYYLSPGISPEIFKKEILNKHSMNGIYLAIGPNINKTELKNISLIDIAPTTLNNHNIKIPIFMDGKIIK